MSFEAEMLVPSEAVDDLGQMAKATITFLRYRLVLGYRAEETNSPGLEIRSEKLEHINLRDARRHIGFPYRGPWANSVLRGRRSGKAFISTERKDGAAYVEIHQDRGTGGRNRVVGARQLPRTVLSTTNAAEAPTALVARREMQSWRLLQFEPTALRAPDSYRAASRIEANGAHIPATLARLAKITRSTTKGRDSNVYAAVANRLAELTEGVRSIRIDEDDKRELLTLLVTDLQGTEHEARALSDGTLRFLALAVLAEDPEAQGLFCLEEPENGIHPARIPAMLRMLNELAVDTGERVGPNNPLRQIIVNTHSPAFVNLVPEDSLIVVKTEAHQQSGPGVPVATFRWLNNTWRDGVVGERALPKGDLLAYLNPAALTEDTRGSQEPRVMTGRRVIDRPDIRQIAMFPLAAEPR
jgi:hypothetical protein